MRNKLWTVSHESFQTDRLIKITSVVIAKTKREALNKYNTLARKRSKYPYMWNVVGLDSVYPFTLEVIE